MIGDIEFKVTGKYNPKFEGDNILRIEYEDVLATVPSEGDLIEVDGKPLLDSFDAWDQLEMKLNDALEAEEEEMLDSEDDVDEIEELKPSRYNESDDFEDEY